RYVTVCDAITGDAEAAAEPEIAVDVAYPDRIAPGNEREERLQLGISQRPFFFLQRHGRPPTMFCSRQVTRQWISLVTRRWHVRPLLGLLGAYAESIHGYEPTRARRQWRRSPRAGGGNSPALPLARHARRSPARITDTMRTRNRGRSA